jgi:IS30 family transposase
MTINKTLVFNYLLDCRKKEVDHFERAKIIQEYLNNNHLTQRGLAKQLGIPHNTIQDWLLWNRLDDKQYKDLKNNQVKDTTIYRALRNNRNMSTEIIVEKAKQGDSYLEELKSINNTLHRFLSNPVFDHNFYEELKDIVTLANRILIKIDRRK